MLSKQGYQGKFNTKLTIEMILFTDFWNKHGSKHNHCPMSKFKDHFNNFIWIITSKPFKGTLKPR